MYNNQSIYNYYIYRWYYFGICVHVYYWLLFVLCDIGWVYVIYDMHIHVHHVIMDMFMSYNITTVWFLHSLCGCLPEKYFWKRCWVSLWQGSHWIYIYSTSQRCFNMNKVWTMHFHGDSMIQSLHSNRKYSMSSAFQKIISMDHWICSQLNISIFCNV